MRRGKRAWRAMAGIGIATLAVASAITAVQTVGPEGGATAYGAPAPRAKQPSAPERAFAAMPLAFVENQRPDRPTRALLRARQPLRVLRDPRRAHALADEGQAGLATRAGTALPRPQTAHAAPVGAKRAPGKVNYLRGKNSSTWQTQLTRYQDIVYRDLWPNIDLRLHQKAGSLKYEFHVHPGARIADIRLAYAGATGLSLDAKGALRITTGLGVLRDSAPVSYQRIAGKRVAVRSSYVLRRGRQGAALRVLRGRLPA